MFGMSVRSVTNCRDKSLFEKGSVSSILNGKRWVLSGISRPYIGDFGSHFMIVFPGSFVDVFGNGWLLYRWQSLVRRFAYFLLVWLVLHSKVLVGWRCIGRVSIASVWLCWDGQLGIRN